MGVEIDIELYKIFYTVANFKNITKASKFLYISQPAVTTSIKKLEEKLETTLFIRTKRGVILTKEGELLYEYIKNAMENIKIGENKLFNLKKLETGNIRIGVGITLTKFFLMQPLEEFHRKYPKISINIDTGITKRVLEDLEHGKLDIGVITTTDLKYKDIDIVYSKDIQDIFVANKEYMDIIQEGLKIEELNNYPLLLQKPESNTRKFLDKVMLDNDIKLNSAMELASYSLVIEFAKIGFGIGFIAKDYVKKELKEGSLFEVKSNIEVPKRKILIVTKKDYLPSFSTSKLIEIINSKNED